MTSKQFAMRISVLVLMFIIPCYAFVMPKIQTATKPTSFKQQQQCAIPLCVQPDDGDAHHMNHLSSATPYNKDIARTLFPRFFFALDRNNSTSTDEQHQRSVRRYPARPCPFQDPTSAQTSERMLRRMMENRYQSDGRTVCPDATTFNLVAGSFGRLRHRKHKGVDDTMLAAVKWDEEPKVNPALRSNMDCSYNQIIKCRHHDDANENAVDRVSMTSVVKLQELLQLQLQLCHYEGWPADLRPSASTYNRIFKRLGDETPDDAQVAWEMFQFMQSTLPASKSSDDMVCEPNAITCFHAIRALTLHKPAATVKSRNKRFEAPKATIQSFKGLGNELGIAMDPTTIPEDASTDWFLHEAEKILGALTKRHNTIPQSQERDELTNILATCISILLEKWSKYAVNGKMDVRLQEEAINRAYELLCSLEQLADAEGSVDIPSSSYASAILGLSVSNDRNAPSKAESILERMRLFESPNTNDIAIAFSACVASYAKIGDAPKAEEVLHQMLDFYESRDDFVPDPRAFGTCIAAWSKYVGLHKSSYQAPHRPDWRQRVKNAENAENVLIELERVIKSERNKNNDEFVVHATPYNIAIQARVQTVRRINKKDYSNKGQFLEDEVANEEVLLRAMSLLDHMEHEMQIAPDSYTFSILLNAWVQHIRPGNEAAADKAEALLKRNVQDSYISASSQTVDEDSIWPNVKHYSSVLKAHAKTKSAGGAKKALSLLSEMERKYSHSNVIGNREIYDEDNNSKYDVEIRDAAKPDIICYSIVIDAFANSRLPEGGFASYRLLGALESKYASGDFSMKPNSRIYTAVIQSLQYSDFIGRFPDCIDANTHHWVNNADVAMHILGRMKNNDVAPNAFTYNYIMNVAAECQSHSLAEARASFEVALSAFQELRNSEVSPDSFTYAFMMKACNNHLPQGSSIRTRTLKNIFKECCHTGHLNNAVLDRLFNGASSDREFFELSGITPLSASNKRQSSSLDMYDLPSSWSRNISMKERYPPKRKNASKTKYTELYQ